MRTVLDRQTQGLDSRGDALGKSFARRPLRLIAADLFNALERPRAALVMGVSVDQLYKIDSGERGIRLDGLEELFRHAAANVAAKIHAIEFLSRLASFIGARIVRDDVVEEAVEMIRNGNGHKEPRCPGCGAELRESGMLMGQRVYICPGCKGVEVQ